MKRLGNLYSKICSVNNLILADKKARRGKLGQHGIKLYDRNPEDNIINLHHVLTNKEYKTSEYFIYTIKDPKEREIFRLPYYPDRIVHHAIMNVLEPIFVKTFTKDTYSCIKKRGIHNAAKAVNNALKDIEGTEYCLKLDIKKFYPNIDHAILKRLLRRKFKDSALLHLLDEIIDSAEGVPIGNYLSQYFANFYLSYFDHWIKETKLVKYYFRYCDDLVIFAKDKESLHKLRLEIAEYLDKELNLEIKSNWQIFPTRIRGLDFLGYVFYGYNYILLRKDIKDRFIKMIKYNKNFKSIASYNGWLLHCNSMNLRNKYLNEERKDIREDS